MSLQCSRQCWANVGLNGLLHSLAMVATHLGTVDVKGFRSLLLNMEWLGKISLCRRFTAVNHLMSLSALMLWPWPPVGSQGQVHPVLCSMTSNLAHPLCV